MARQDKIVSWSDVYNEINRIINLPPTGKATSFEGTTDLPIEDVEVGNTIDDTDVEQLIERYNAIKNDSLYGSATQLNTSHVSSTVNLYNATLDPVQENTLIEAITDANAKSIKYNMSRIICRNIVTCNNSYYYYCTTNTWTECHDCGAEYYTCPSRRLVCYDVENIHCSGECYQRVCNQTCSQCSSNYYLVCTRCTDRRPCTAVGSHDSCQKYESVYDCSQCYDVCGNYYYTYTADYYYCSPQCYDTYYTGCTNTAACGRYYYTAGCTQTIETPCQNVDHNDILCSNTYWAGN